MENQKKSIEVIKKINNFKKQYKYNFEVTKMIFKFCGEDNEKIFYDALGDKGKYNYMADYYDFIISEEEALRCYYEAEYEVFVSKLN
jgi:hypothetical protein